MLLGRLFLDPRAVRKVTDRLDIAKEQPPPNNLQSDKEEATEDGLVWFVKETEVPDVMARQKDAVYVRLDSITEIGEEYEARLDREQLADTQNGCKLTLKMVEALGNEGSEFVRLALPMTTRDKDKGTTSEVSSPNLSDFENFMDRCAKERPSTTRNTNQELSKSNEKHGSDEDDDLETFENLEVRARSKRKQPAASAIGTAREKLLRLPEDDLHSRVVALDDILPESRSDDDDEVPIVSTLKLMKPKRKARKRVLVKWTYETVAEPTGDQKLCNLLYSISLS